MRMKRREQALAERRAHGQRLGRRHAHRRRAAGLPRRARASPATRAAPRCSIVSDGLERGDATALADAVARLARRAWRISWLTPLATDKHFRPQTEALVAISRFVDDMVDGGSTRGDRRSRPLAGAQEEPLDPDRRRPSPHLAPGRPALAHRPDAAAHLRPLRADPARLSDRGISRRRRRRRRRQVGLCPDQLGASERYEDEAAWVQRTADETGWPHAIVAYADFGVDDVRPQLDRLARYRLVRGVRMQLHWHERRASAWASALDSNLIFVSLVTPLLTRAVMSSPN